MELFYALKLNNLSVLDCTYKQFVLKDLLELVNGAVNNSSSGKSYIHDKLLSNIPIVFMLTNITVDRDNALLFNG